MRSKKLSVIVAAIITIIAASMAGIGLTKPKQISELSAGDVGKNICVVGELRYWLLPFLSVNLTNANYTGFTLFQGDKFLPIMGDLEQLLDRNTLPRTGMQYKVCGKLGIIEDVYVIYADKMQLAK